VWRAARKYIDSRPEKKNTGARRAEIKKAHLKNPRTDTEE